MHSTKQWFPPGRSGTFGSIRRGLCCLLAIGTACSDAATSTESQTDRGPFGIAPDTQWVYVNELARFTGAGVGSTDRCQWTIADEGIASVDGSGVITPRTAGSTSVRLTCSARSATSILVVGGMDDRSVRRLALGDSARDTVDLGGSRARFEVQLTKGDTVDVITNGGFLADYLPVRAPLLTLGAPVGRYQQYLGIVVPETRAYLFHVDRIPHPCSGSGSGCSLGFALPYRLVVRRSGPVMNTINSGYFANRVVRQGEVTHDTMWVQNVGAGSFDLLATIDSAPWAGVVARVAVPGPTRLDTILGGPHASGVVPIVLTLDARTLVSGVYRGTLNLQAAGVFDVYGGGPGSLRGRTVQAIVYDSLVRYGPAPSSPSSMIASTPSGTLYVQTSNGVSRYDTLTGSLSAHVAIAPYSSPIRLGPDGAAYGAYGTRILRVGRSGDSTEISTGGAFANHLVVLPDSRIYFFGLDRKLYRIGADGMRSDVITLNAASVSGGNLVFNPTNNSLYFMEGSSLHRVDLSRRTEEVIPLRLRPCNAAVVYVCAPSAVDTPDLFTVDGSGRLYGAGSGVVVISPDGTVVEEFLPGRKVNGLAVVGNTLFGSTGTIAYGDPPNIWRRPVR